VVVVLVVETVAVTVAGAAGEVTKQLHAELICFAAMALR